MTDSRNANNTVSYDLSGLLTELLKFESVSVSVCFNGHFPGETALAGVY